MAEQQPISTEALRAEHDALAGRLASRASVDVLRRALALGFLGFLSLSLSWAVLWDRYGAHPTEFALAHTTLFHVGYIVAGLVALTLLTFAVLALRRRQRLAREEEAQFARLKELRRALGIDP